MHKALKELGRRQKVIDDLNRDVHEDTQAEWDNIRLDIERRRATPMPSAQRRRGVTDAFGPRSVDGLLETAEKGKSIRRGILIDFALNSVAPNRKEVEDLLLAEEDMCDDGEDLVRPIIASLAILEEQ